MAKKRKCRMNEEEILVHEMAIKLRKKTDKQLVDEFEDQFRKGKESAGISGDDIDLLTKIGVQTISKAGKEKTVSNIIQELVSIIARSRQRKSDGFFKSSGAKYKFLEIAKQTPGIGAATYRKIENLVNGQTESGVTDGD
ncbi:hypothetical protein NXH76_11930 [Blautia schinkii]|nr:hypothetical protein [Blautia schinkii]